MYDKRAERQAAELGILDRMQALEADLLKIEGISDIDFDIDNYADFPQVILVPRYSVPLDENYYKNRGKQLAQIIQVCENNGLLNSGDRIEDYGEHWYIVRKCGTGWPRKERSEQ